MKNWPNQFPAVGAPDYSHSELFILSASTADSWWVYWHCPGEISLCQAWCIHSVLQLCEGLHRLCLPARIQKLKGIRRWELKRMTFHGNVLLLSPLAWWKVCPRCPEIGFLLLFFSFFLQKKEPIMQWGIACNVVQLRCLSLLQIVWQRASLHGYKTKCWTTQHFFFSFLCEKHTRNSWMVPVWQVGEIFPEPQKTKCFRVQGETQELHFIIACLELEQGSAESGGDFKSRNKTWLFLTLAVIQLSSITVPDTDPWIVYSGPQISDVCLSLSHSKLQCSAMVTESQNDRMLRGWNGP